MTTDAPRVPFAHLRELARRVPRARFASRWFASDHAHASVRKAAPARPPAFVVVCATVVVLNIVGLVMILSASSVEALSDHGSSWYFFNRQLLWAVLGASAFLLAARLDYHRWRRLVPLVLVGTVALLVAVLVIGKEVGGGRRWLGVGPLQLQPSELAKLAIVVCVAEILTRRADRLHDPRQWRPVIGVLGVLAILIVREPDLDTVVVLGMITLALLVVAGVPRKHLGTLLVLGMGATLILANSASYRRARMLTFLNPMDDAKSTGYQITQSLTALGSGGFSGVGLGAGRAKWQFLPNAHTDFIFAIIGEELGLVGCLLVLALFAGFGVAGFHVARRAPDRFGMLTAAGVTVWIAGQAMINLGAVVGLLPVSGITLPFLSVGGSSLVITMAGAGVLANIARQCPARAGDVAPPARPRSRSQLVS